MPLKAKPKTAKRKRSSSVSSPLSLSELLGGVLGSGENATVYAHKTNPKLVIKVVKDASSIRHEMQMHRMMACIGVAPAIEAEEDNFIVMERIVPYKKGDKLTKKHQTQLVNLVLRSVAVGLIHNDLHQGNIGFTANKEEMLMFDFGFSERIQPVKDDVVYLQIVLAQLYALIDPCNENNMALNFCDDEIGKAVYAIRGHDTKVIKQFLKQRTEALKMLNCVTDVAI